MASFQAHFLDLLMRTTLKPKVRRSTDVAMARATLEGGKLPVPRDVDFVAGQLGGINGEWVRGRGAAAGPMLYLHGGGYFACSPRTHRPITAAYAQRGFAVFVPDYRLAPEHPFPAAVQDAEAAWNGLLALGHTPQTVAISGDSAGGGLSLALLLSLRDQKARLPGAAALFSPWTDLACTGASMTQNTRRDAMFTASGLREAGGFYLDQAPAETPLASPLYADLTGLPPLLIHVGDRELLRDDSTRLADSARNHGVPVEMRIWPVVPHVWQLASFVPEARASLDQAAAFLKAHCCC